MSAPTVNQSLAILLLPDSNVRLVRCAYHGLDEQGRPLDDAGRPGGTTIMFKTLLPDLTKGDLVIVPTNTRAKYTVVQVADTDVEPDFESHTQVAWIVDRFNEAPHKDILAREEQFLQVWRVADRKRRQAELQQQFLGVIPEDMRKSLPVLDLKPEGKSEG